MLYTLLTIFCLILAACIVGNMIRISDQECEIGDEPYGDVVELPSHTTPVTDERR